MAHLWRGVITEYSDRLPMLAGAPTVTLREGGTPLIPAEHLSELPYVEHFALVGGDFDVLLLVRTPDNAALRDVVLVSLQALDGVRSTRTWLIFDEADGPGALGPPDPGTVG